MVLCRLSCPVRTFAPRQISGHGASGAARCLRLLSQASPAAGACLGKNPFALACIAALAALKIRGAGGYIANLSHLYSPVARLFMVCYSFGFYPFKALVPYGFSAFYPFPVKNHDALPIIYYAARFC